MTLSPQPVNLCYAEIMSDIYSDTHPQVEELQIRLLRQEPVWRKLEMFTELNATARMLALSGLRRRHPDADQDELRFWLAVLLYGEELAEKALRE
ncbi:hypothetical protein KQH40_01330 [bacterium]|nr:hypothetical protein [bacterium]